MGQTLSAPITEKESTDGQNEHYAYGTSCMQGWRVCIIYKCNNLAMEDAHTTLLNLKDDPKLSFFGVFDGHGGFKVAQYSGQQLCERIISDSAFIDKDYRLAIKNGYLGIDIDLRANPEFAQEMSGCTAVSALFVNDVLHIGNAGDSRAVLCHKGKAIELSYDHKPMNASESQRITKAGGFVEAGRVNGNLALSRALGDFEFKQNQSLSAEEQAVTANPDVTIHKIHMEDEFLILACDGIWDCLSSQEAVNFVRKCISERITLSKACEMLMDRCLATDCDYAGIGCDNMTVILIAILNGKTLDEWYDQIAIKTSENKESLLLSTSKLENDTNEDNNNIKSENENSQDNTEVIHKTQELNENPDTTNNENGENKPPEHIEDKDQEI